MSATNVDMDNSLLEAIITKEADENNTENKTDQDNVDGDDGNVEQVYKTPVYIDPALHSQKGGCNLIPDEVFDQVTWEDVGIDTTTKLATTVFGLDISKMKSHRLKHMMGLLKIKGRKRYQNSKLEMFQCIYVHKMINAESKSDRSTTQTYSELMKCAKVSPKARPLPTSAALNNGNTATESPSVTPKRTRASNKVEAYLAGLEQDKVNQKKLKMEETRLEIELMKEKREQEAHKNHLIESFTSKINDFRKRKAEGSVPADEMEEVEQMLTYYVNERKRLLTETAAPVAPEATKIDATTTMSEACEV